MASHPSSLRRAALALLLLAVLTMGLGVWAQLQDTALTEARTAAASQAEGLAPTPPVPLVLQPFDSGRLPAFLYDPATGGTVFGAFARLGGAIGLVGLFLLTLRGATPAPTPATAPAPAEPVVPAMPQVQPRRPVRATDWRQRVAEKAATPSATPSATPADQPAPDAAPQPAPRLGRLLHRAALAIVGLGFVFISAIVLIDRLGPSGLSLPRPAWPTGLADLPARTLAALRTGDSATLLQAGLVAMGILVLALALRTIRRQRAATGANPAKTRALTRADFISIN